MLITQIEWDVDEPEDLEGLPREVEAPDGVDGYDIADYLSDEYGYFVSTFNVEGERDRD